MTVTTVTTIDRSELTLLVLPASADEIAQHEDLLAGLDKGVKGECVWRNYSQQG